MQRKSFGSMSCPDRSQPGAGRRVVEHPDPAGRVPRADAVRPVPEEPGHRAEHADPAAERPCRDPACWSGGRIASIRPGHEYVLSDRGRDFRPVLWSLLAWGNRHFAPEGPSVIVVDTETGEPADPVLVDRRHRQGDG